MRSSNFIVLAILALAIGCAGLDDWGGGLFDSPDEPPEGLKAKVAEVEAALGTEHLAAQAIPLSGGAPEQVWVGARNVLAVCSDRSVWSISRHQGTIRFGFSTGDRPVVGPPATSRKRTHVLCDDGHLFVLDENGATVLDEASGHNPTGPPAGTGRHTAITVDRRPGHQLRVYSLETPGEVRTEELPPARSCLTIAGRSRVFVLSDEQLLGFSISPLKKRWSVPCPEPAPAPLALDDVSDRLYVAGQRLRCFDTGDGELAWRVDLEGGTATQVMVAGDRVFLVVSGGTSSGVWRLDIGAETATRGWTAPDADLVLAVGKHVMVRTGVPGSYRLVALSIDDGTEAYAMDLPPQITLFAPNHHGPRVVLGMTYTDRAGAVFWLSPTE